MQLSETRTPQAYTDQLRELPKTRSEVRDCLVDYLKMAPLPEEIWDELSKGASSRVSGYLRVRKRGGRGDRVFPNLLKEAEHIKKMWKVNELTTSSFDTDHFMGQHHDDTLVFTGQFDHLLNSEERVRANAIAEDAARRMAEGANFRDFRTTYLRDTLLPVNTVNRFVRSPAVALLTPEIFEAWGIALATHVSGVRLEAGSEDARCLLTVKSPEGLMQNFPCPSDVATRLFPDLFDSNVVRPLQPFSSGTVLGVLFGLADEVMRDFDCDFWAACFFILAGKEITINPVEVMSHMRGGTEGNARIDFWAVTLKARSWVSPKTIDRIYRAIHAELWERKTSQEAGTGRTRERSMGRRNPFLYDFVTGVEKELDRRVEDWNNAEKRRCVAAWNEKAPALAAQFGEGKDWTFVQETVSRFYHEYRRTRDSIQRVTDFTGGK